MITSEIRADRESSKGAQGRKRIMLIDGSGYIFRAYYALPSLTRKSDGLPIGAVSGFCNMLNKLLDDALTEGDVTHLAVIFDSARRSFRNEIYPQYKSHRPPPPEDLVPQFSLVREATRAFNVSCIEMEGFEADDLIATYASRSMEAGYDVVIVSSDKDLMQIVGEHIKMHDPMKQLLIGEEQVREKFGVFPDRVIDVQALAGDSSDNVPGVPGIGPKTAAQLINCYGNLDGVLAHVEEIKQPKRRQSLIENAELAKISRELVTLRRDVPVPGGIEDLKLAPPDPKSLFAFLDEMGLVQLSKRLEAKISGRSGQSSVLGAGEGGVPATADYTTVTNEQQLREWAGLAELHGIVAVDTETTSLDIMRADLVGISMSVKPGRACYIPVGHVIKSAKTGHHPNSQYEDAAEIEQIPLERVIEILKPILENNGILKVGQNIKYDMAILAKYGIQLNPIDDTMLLSFVLEGGLHGHGMDELAPLHIGTKPISFKDIVGTGKSQVTFDQVPLDKATEYAAEDADVTCRLYEILKPRLVAERMVNVYETIERPLVRILADMELNGIRVDQEELQYLSVDFEKRIAQLEEKIHGLAGREFNIGSPKQLGEVMFDEMSMCGGKKSKNGAYLTGAEVLEELVAQGNELPGCVLNWRQLSKLKGTYTDALQGQINPETGRVHTSYSMATVATGRLASSKPNLQNIPIRTEEGRRIRQAFVAADGCRLLSADYSQIELRLLAHIADIAELKKAFLSGDDIHARTASEVFGVPMEGMSSSLRRSAKAINFGIIYGISPFGLARQLAIPQKEAKAYIEAYFYRYPGIQAYMKTTKQFAQNNGFVTTLFGRRVHVPSLRDKNPSRRNFGERAAINAPLQGSAADIIKRAMVKIPNALVDRNLSARMLLQVHDELLFDVPEAEIEETKLVISDLMEGAAQLSVPLIVDTGIGLNWDEAH